MDTIDPEFGRGSRNRRAILGDAWVDRSQANASAFTADLKDLITRYAWHGVWGRPGLDERTRRIIVLAITCAMGRWGNAHHRRPQRPQCPVASTSARRASQHCCMHRNNFAR